MKIIIILALLISANAFSWTSYDESQDSIADQALMNNQRQELEMQDKQMRNDEYNTMYNRTFGR